MLDVIRAGFTDFGKTTTPLATIKARSVIRIMNEAWKEEVHTQISEQNVGYLKGIFLGNRGGILVGEKWRIAGSKRGIALGNYTFRFEVGQ